MSCQVLVALTAQDETALLTNLGNYPPHADDAFEEVSTRIATHGFATKLDIGGLAAWKRLRCDTKWARRLQLLPQATVQTATAAAFASGLTAAQRGERLRKGLTHGMGGTFALGSAILTAWNPAEFAITDRRARAKFSGLLKPLGCGCNLGRDAVYLEHVVALRDRLNTNQPPRRFSTRDVDKALFT